MADEFAAPLEFLWACDRRIEQQCAKLRHLHAELAAHGTTELARVAAAGLVRDFDSSTREHLLDEERELFPVLIESMAGSDPVCLRELTESLAAEHRALEADWQRVRIGLAKVAAGEPPALAVEELEALADRYRRHIEREEQELFPMAARLLSEDELARIDRSMRERRKNSAV